MECSLTKGELIRLERGQGSFRLNCNAGTIWLTTGDGIDRLIKAGSCFEIPAGCLVVAEALEFSKFHMGGTHALNSRPTPTWFANWLR
jgi:hypothetical protein